MRKISTYLVAITFFLCTFSVAHAQTIYPNSVSGCIARYNFSALTPLDSLSDVSGNNNDGISYNLMTTKGFRDTPNTAMHFDGATSYASIASNAKLSPAAITIVALVKLDTFYSGDCQESQFIIKGYPDGASGVYQMGVSDNVYDGSCNAYNPNNQQLISGFGPSNYALPVGNYVQLHQWYLYAASYDSTTYKQYFIAMDTAHWDSSVAPIYSQTDNLTPIGTNTSDIVIGHTFNPPFPYWMAGSMDELALFNKVLNDAEMQQVYNYLWGYHVSASVPDVTNNPNFKILPNPSNGSFTLDGNFVTIGSISIEVKNMIGQSIYTENLGYDNKMRKQVVLPNSVPNGVYIVRINSNSEYYTQRIVINR